MFLSLNMAVNGVTQLPMFLHTYMIVTWLRMCNKLELL